MWQGEAIGVVLAAWLGKINLRIRAVPRMVLWATPKGQRHRSVAHGGIGGTVWPQSARPRRRAF
jgi:hypothetical protein